MHFKFILMKYGEFNDMFHLFYAQFITFVSNFNNSNQVQYDT